jgi:hypothetical protein
MFFKKKKIKKAEITLVEAVGLVLAAALILIIFTPIANFLKDFIDETTPSENALNLLGENINSLISSSKNFDQVRSMPISIEKGYSIIGFDSEYESVLSTDFIGNYNFKMVGDGSKNMSKPSECGNNACVCLYKDSKKVINCVSFPNENLIIAGLPFYDPHKSFTIIPALFNKVFSKIIDVEEWDWPLQNIGGERDKNNKYISGLSKYNFDNSFFDYYGYLYLNFEIYYLNNAKKSIKWGVRSVYLEKIEVGEYTFILIIPTDSNYKSGEGHNLANELVNARFEIYSSVVEQIQENFLADIKKHNDSKKYLELFETCEEYYNAFPHDKFPPECKNIGKCSKSVISSGTGCEINQVPCVCMSREKNEVCEEDNKFCYYNSGCSPSQVTSEIECGMGI